MMHTFILLAALTIVGMLEPLSAQAQGLQRRENGPRIIEASGYTLNVSIQWGDAALPVIVLESGGGLDSSQWASIQPRLATDTRATVIAYDRPGFGRSPLPETAYDILAEVDAIRLALESLVPRQKILLVAHSYGALLAQVWAARAPDQVTGILFLDPNSPAMMLAAGREMAPRESPGATTPRQKAFARMDRTGSDPFSAVYRHHLPLNIPVIVLSAERPPFRDPRLADAFRLSHELLAKSVIRGRHITITGSDHNIPAQAPEQVISYVKELLAAP